MTWITPSFLRGTIEIPRSWSRCLVKWRSWWCFWWPHQSSKSPGREWIKPTIHYQKNHGDEHPASSSTVSKNQVKNRVPRSRNKKSPRHKSFSEIKFISSGSIWEGAGFFSRQPRSGWKIFSFQMCSAYVLSFQKLAKFTKILGKIASNGHRRPRRTRGDVGTSINPGHPMSPILKVNKYLKSDFLWSKIIFQTHISIYSDLNSLISI